MTTAPSSTKPREDLVRELAATCRELESELAAAADVQRWLLPPLTLPDSGVRAAASYITARHAGGDYYDAGVLPNGRFGVIIADVSGHGAAAAVLMAILRTVVHDEVDRWRVIGAAAVLDHADDHLCSLGLPGRGWFVTAFSGSLDTRTGALTYSCAGHPPPRLVRADRTVIPLDDAATQPLGVLAERPPRPEATVRLAPGDLVVFYSDGITEARGPARTLFGAQRLDRVLAGLPPGASPEDAVSAIRSAVAAFSGQGPPTDDQTILAVRWMA